MPRERTRLRAALRRMLRAGTPYCVDLDLVRDDGGTMWLRVSGRPRREGARVAGMVGAVEDVTERRATERQMERQNRMLATIGRMQWLLMIGELPPGTLYEGLLSELLGCSGSEYGFLGEVLYETDADGNSVPFLRTFALTNIAWDEQTRRFYEEKAPHGFEFRNLDTLFGSAMRTRRTVIANAPAIGALYMRSGERNLFESVIVWGDAPATEEVFESGACWALRRGRSYHHGAGSLDLCCGHVPEHTVLEYLCVPLTAQGQTIGMLHLQGVLLAAAAGNAETAPRYQPVARVGLDTHEAERLRRLAETLTEYVSLAIANVRLRETLRRRAIRDTGTGLYDRRFLEEALERELRRSARKQTSLSLCMIDVDHFKRFNDTYGHEAGDTVLREVGALLQHNIRREDYACRFGGEEFVLLLPDATFDGAVSRADTLRSMVAALVLEHLGAPIGPVTISVGVAAAPRNGVDAASLLAAADAALYEAKRAGRDQVRGAVPAAEPAPLGDRREDAVIVV